MSALFSTALLVPSRRSHRAAAPPGAALGGDGSGGSNGRGEPHEPGLTSLSFETDERLETVQTRLAAAGFESSIIDESYGRSLHITDPDGIALVVGEAMTDDYGYRRT